MPPVAHLLAHPRPNDNSILIHRWRHQRVDLRKQLLQLVCSRLSSATQHEQEECLERFCTELIDYVSTGHFEIYSGLMHRQAASDHELRILFAYLHRCIGSSTDLVLEFNSICQRANVFVRSNQMTEALSKLTRSLIVRFALEEQMLELTMDHEH